MRLLNLQKQEKLRLGWMYFYSLGGSDDKSVVVLLGSEGGEKKNEATWKMSESREKEQGQSVPRFSVPLIHIHGSLAASGRVADVTNLIKAPARICEGPNTMPRSCD